MPSAITAFPQPPDPRFPTFGTSCCTPPGALPPAFSLVCPAAFGPFEYFKDGFIMYVDAADPSFCSYVGYYWDFPDPAPQMGVRNIDYAPPFALPRHNRCSGHIAVTFLNVDWTWSFTTTAGTWRAAIWGIHLTFTGGGTNFLPGLCHLHPRPYWATN